jgi:hypothetical protein
MESKEYKALAFEASTKGKEDQMLHGQVLASLSAVDKANADKDKEVREANNVKDAGIEEAHKRGRKNGDNLTSDAGGKAVLQVPAGVTTYRENQTRNYTLGRAMTAHSWGVNDPATRHRRGDYQRAAGLGGWWHFWMCMGIWIPSSMNAVSLN